MITYIIKTVLCSFLFIAIYKVFLEKENMPHFNRFYLLSSLILAFCIPMITFTVNADAPVSDFAAAMQFGQSGSFGQLEYYAPSDMQTTANNNVPLFNIYQIAVIVYIVISTILLLRFIFNLRNIRRRIAQSEIIRRGNTNLVLTTGDTSPHTFLNYIFIGKADYENNLIEQEVISHECAHVRQKHTLDNIFTELLLIFNWFNPALYIYKKSIAVNHEYLADKSALETSCDIYKYQQLLVGKLEKPGYHNNITHQFCFLTIKKRLIMMTKTTSRRSAAIRITAVAIFIFGAVMLFSSKSIAQTPETLSQSAATSLQSISKTSNEGVSQALMEEYAQILGKYYWKESDGSTVMKTTPTNQSDLERMKEIYGQMSPEQKAKQEVTPVRLKPIPLKTPTKEEYDSWKNSNCLVLIDLRVRDKSMLNIEKNSEFGYYKILPAGSVPGSEGKDFVVSLLSHRSRENFNKIGDRLILFSINSLAYFQ